MQWIHARRPVAVGAFIIVSMTAMLGARTAPRHEVLPASHRSESPIAVSDPCAGDCGIDWEVSCGSTEHVMDTDGPKLDHATPHGTHGGCKPEICAWEGGTVHPQCAESLNLAKSGDYDRLKAAIAAQDDRVLHQLLSRYPKVLVVSAKRESILVVGCSRTLRANLPMQTEQFNRLVNAQ